MVFSATTAGCSGRVDLLYVVMTASIDKTHPDLHEEGRARKSELYNQYYRLNRERIIRQTTERGRMVRSSEPYIRKQRKQWY